MTKNTKNKFGALRYTKLAIDWYQNDEFGDMKKLIYGLTLRIVGNQSKFGWKETKSRVRLIFLIRLGLCSDYHAWNEECILERVMV